ncbi:MAG: FecR family protein [Planctomycetota bacterium]
MTEQDDTYFLELWNDFLEGELQEPQMVELRELLESDERLLQVAADSYQLHRLLGVHYAEASSMQSEQREAFVRATMKRLPTDSERFVGQVMHDLRPSKQTEKSRSALMKWSALSLVTSLGLLIAAGIFWWRAQQEHTIASITGLSGSMIWTGDGGRVVSNPEVGTRLGGGSLEGLAPSSWVELTFDDGSKITLSGNSQLTYSEIEQKQLHLREGNLTADVAKQPEGRPMLIHTRSAKLEVLGTQFNVEAGLSSTILDVNEGEVQLTRTVDKESVHVSAQQRAVASIEHVLQPKQSPNFVETWQSHLELGPEETFGKWSPASADAVASLKAIPFVFEPEGSGKSVTLFLAATSVSRGDSPPVLLQPNAAFRLQGNLKPGKELFFGFQVHKPNGEFAGKFLSRSKPTWADPANPEKFEAVMELDGFKLDPSLAPYAERLPKTPAGLIITGCWCFTFEQHGLELQQAELTPSP